MDYREFGAKVKFHRLRLKMTQNELAVHLGVSQVTIANYERGLRFPKPARISALARVLGLSFETLLGTGEEAVSSSGLIGFDIEGFLEVLRNGKIQEAEEYLEAWKNKERYGLEEIFSRIVIPILHLSGDRWMKGQLLISEEHLITQRLKQIIIISSAKGKAGLNLPKKQESWMGLCAPGENHEMGLLMSAELMRQSGWKTYYLGPNTPLYDLKKMIEIHNPEVVTLSVTMKENLNGLVSYLEELRRSFGEKIRIICGGAVLDSAPREISILSDGLAASIEEGRELAKKK